MKVVLLSPPSRVINHYRPPLALMYLSGYLKHNNIDAEIIDVTLKEQVRDKNFYKQKDEYLRQTENEILDRVRKSETDIVGITCYTPEFLEVESLAGKIKSIKPKIKIIAGGIHPTLYPEDFLGASSNFDFVVVGEGELTLFKLVEAIRESNPNYGNVEGIGYFDQRNSKCIITPRRPLAHDLDEIAFPDCQDLDMNFYTTASPYAIRGVFTRSFYISSSRGCPSSCTFCVSKKMREYHGIERFIRLRSSQSLFNEIEELRNKYKIDSFYFIDDLFTLKKENVHEFCNLMIKNKSPLIWGCSSKVNTVDFEVLRAMRNAGCVQIDFGVERGSDQALKFLKKGINIKQINDAFNSCKKLEIRTFANMLVNVPEEKEEDLEDILKIVRQIKPCIVTFNIFTPYPGCEIYDLFRGDMKKQDYPLLAQDPSQLVANDPKRFRFATHNIDFAIWVSKATKKFNRILPNILIYFNPKYLKSFFLSRNKRDYLKQIRFLLREFITLKF